MIYVGCEGLQGWSVHEKYFPMPSCETLIMNVLLMLLDHETVCLLNDSLRTLV